MDNLTTASQVETAFIIGGTGNIGATLIESLRPEMKAGTLRVRGGARSDAAAAALREMGAEPVAFDLEDRREHPERLERALAGSDVLFLLTGYSVDMLAQSKAVIDAAQAAGVRHIVHLGLMALPNTPGIHHGWHQMIEAYIERTGLDWTHLHPNMFMNSFPIMQLQNGVYPIAEHGPVIFKGYLNPDLPASWIDAPDIGRAAAAVIRDAKAHRGRSYDLAVDSLTMPELVRLAGEAYDRDFRYEQVPIDILDRALAASGMEAKYAESGSHTMVLANKGLLPDFGDVHDDFECLTGLEPMRWRQAVHRYPEWFSTGLASSA